MFDGNLRSGKLKVAENENLDIFAELQSSVARVHLHILQPLSFLFVEN